MDLVIAAFAQERRLNQNYRLVVAGADLERGELARLREQVVRMGVQGRVEFTGFVTGPRLRALYEQASLYVSAKEREAFPLTPAEALMSGTPVVLGPLPVFRELYSDWAHIAPAGDPRTLSDTMLSALSSPKETRVTDQVRVAFSWERNGYQLKTLFEAAALSERGKRIPHRADLDFSAFGRLARTLAGTSPK